MYRQLPVCRQKALERSTTANYHSLHEMPHYQELLLPPIYHLPMHWSRRLDHHSHLKLSLKTLNPPQLIFHPPRHHPLPLASHIQNPVHQKHHHLTSMTSVPPLIGYQCQIFRNKNLVLGQYLLILYLQGVGAEIWEMSLFLRSRRWVDLVLGWDHIDLHP